MVAGGKGDDTISAETQFSGAVYFDGGRGDDQITASFGFDTLNFVLDGKGGDDRIVDFEGAQDGLNILLSTGEITDSGAAGLVDDIDALSTVTDFGAGADVLLEFFDGSSVTFVGYGAGTATSVGDLLVDAYLISDATLLDGWFD